MLPVEIDLATLAQNLPDLIDYNPEKYPGAYVRFEENDPLVTVYRTGKYIVTGASSETETDATRERFLSLLSELGVLSSPNDVEFAMQNFVCTGELDELVNLNALAIKLGLERTEYEPEQFPGLIYRPANHNAVVLIFATGKVVITGAKNPEEAEAVFETVKQEVTNSR